MVAWTEQVKYRGLSEQSNDILVTTKSCKMKLIIGITLKNSSSTALERSFINNWGGGGLKLVLQIPSLTLGFSSGS